jgi:hypothetical protein
MSTILNLDACAGKRLFHSWRIIGQAWRATGTLALSTKCYEFSAFWNS